jgi:hypothetical protein
MTADIPSFPSLLQFGGGFAAGPAPSRGPSDNLEFQQVLFLTLDCY